MSFLFSYFFFFFNDTATTEIYTLSLHDALPISARVRQRDTEPVVDGDHARGDVRQHARGPLPRLLDRCLAALHVCGHPLKRAEDRLEFPWRARREGRRLI